MKRMLLVSIFALTTIVLSCGTDDNSNSQEEQNSEVFKAKINGESFEAENVSAILSNDGERLVIIGSISNQLIKITLGTPFENEFPIQEQTYTLDGSSIGTITYTLNGEEYLNRVDVTGAFITVSSIDISNKKISGTFSASVSTISDPATILISNGVIENIEFTEQ